MRATNFCGTGGSPAPMARGPSALGDSSSSCLDLEPSLIPIFLRWSSSALLGMTPMLVPEQEMKGGEGGREGGGGGRLILRQTGYSSTQRKAARVFVYELARDYLRFCETNKTARSYLVKKQRRQRARWCELLLTFLRSRGWTSSGVHRLALVRWRDSF